MPMGTWLRRSLPLGCGDLVKQYESATFRGGEASERDLEGEILNAKQRWKEQEKTPGTNKVHGV